MQDHFIPNDEPGDDFRNAIITMADLDGRNARAAVADHEDRPLLAAPKQRADRNGQCVIGAPNRDVNDHPIVMPKA